MLIVGRAVPINLQSELYFDCTVVSRLIMRTVRLNAMTTTTSRIKTAKVTAKKLDVVVIPVRVNMKPLCGGNIWEDRNTDFVVSVQ